MRILHTADWHAGKTLFGFDRTPEIAAALQELAEAAKEHAVDAILVAGDLYDTRNPGADADEAVFGFFKAVNEQGIPAVVIGGNHDSYRRLDALTEFMGLHAIHIVGRPRAPQQGGTLTLEANGERMMVACFPFVSTRVLRTSEELVGQGQGEGIVTYQDRVRQFMAALCKPFRSDTANVLMMHGTMDGAVLSGSEYTFHSGRDYVVNPNHVPDTVSYVAMGHVHKPQALRGHSEDQGRYSGSLVQLDFGEAGDAKFAYVVDLQPGAPARTHAAIPLTAGRELRQERLTLAEVDARERELRSFPGHLKLILKLDRHDPSVRERVRRALPNARIIQVEVPRREGQAEVREAVSLSLQENFERYWREGHGGRLDPDVMRLFQELQARVEGEEMVGP